MCFFLQTTPSNVLCCEVSLYQPPKKVALVGGNGIRLEQCTTSFVLVSFTFCPFNCLLKMYGGRSECLENGYYNVQTVMVPFQGGSTR